MERPLHGDVRIYDTDPENEARLVEYVVRFTHGRVEWVRPVEERGDPVPEPSPTEAPAPVAEETLMPAVWGRLVSAEEFIAHVPEKLELVRGEIPGAEELLLLLLTSLGLRRAAILVGPERWKKALGDDGPARS